MMRALTSVLLSLVLALTSHSAAMARGATTAVDQVVICVGATVVTVYVDRDGQPTEAPHLCPDCALHILAAALPPAVDVSPVDASGQTHAWTPFAHHGERAVASALARAPPSLI